MEECRHKNSCDPYCPLYVKENSSFRKEYGVHCALEAIWEKIEDIEEELDGKANDKHYHDEYEDNYDLNEIKQEIEDIKNTLGKTTFKYGIRGLAGEIEELREEIRELKRKF